MKVTLLKHTPDPELLCAAAAMTSYKGEGTSRLLAELNLEKARKTLRRVLSSGHVSVTEHASFTFSVEGVSRALTHQLVRHRIASYTQQSQRYVTYDTLDQYVTPPSVLENQKAKQIYDETLTCISAAYQELLKNAVPKEDARFTLPNAAKTNILITMNARELCHFFRLRCCARSQWEIRRIAIEMLKLAKQAAPVIFENAGPSCIEFGYCPEGVLKEPDCNIKEIKRQFREM
ncbi:MAG: FAD-dependent thymidylate synthase [Candidatus Bathyarchaeota archaeon]|nr:MAG: FAD-dependent thymidylate synthase [Candidatus Bathyarchaeota archaeon]